MIKRDFLLIAVCCQPVADFVKVTWWASNSGPSTQANIILPHTCTLHPPT
jgi:hypothetical protein